MSKELLLNWITCQKDTLDIIISNAAKSYWDEKSNVDNIKFDINESSKECYDLSKSKDLCYDRPSIGFAYSLWYHGKRVNTFLKYFTEIIYESRNEEHITVYDLGAGTGAIQWACGLIYVALKKNGLNCPKFSIINIDTSPFMMDYNNSFLWPNFLITYPEAKGIYVEYNLNSWNNTEKLNNANHWITASYLFDHSENIENLKIDFLNLLENFQPQKILLLSSFNKRHFTSQLSSTLKANNYVSLEIESDLLFTGVMNRTLAIRNWFKNNENLNFNGLPTWNDNTLYGVVLSSNQPLFNLFGAQQINQINIYKPPIKVRREITLNKDQEKASIPDERPTIITGPAGCGKSVVITERIAKVVENHIKTNQLDTLSVLVTTFNKELSYFLQGWILELLDKKNIKYTKYENYGVHIEGSNFLNIIIYHFDVLPTRLWRLYSPDDYPFNGDNLQFDDYHTNISQIAIQEIKKEEKITTSEYDNVLNSEYVLDEYHRIIYGNDYSSEEIYLNSIRKGRPTLQYGGIRRKLLFKTIIKYLEILEINNSSSIITRRNKFLKKLKNGHINNKFEYLFVDEFQDCTQSDYTIFYRLIKNPNNLVIAGDYAQAVHIGKNADIPRDNDETTERMRNRNYIKLEGSYRLPYRISEAIKPISESIKSNGQEETDIITPYKGSPPGARPIFVYANNENLMAQKIKDIVTEYSCFDVVDFNSKRITILEKDKSLTNILNNLTPEIAETDTILRLKGMEKTCVVWSTKIRIEDEDEIPNFIYTILTRTSGLLIIAIFDNILDEYTKIIKQFREDRIIKWDKESELWLNQLK
jgi:hypothetical protein